MRIIVAPADVAGCGAYRMIWPYEALRACGYDVQFTQHLNDARLHYADVLVLQRATNPQVLGLVRMLKARGVRIVYELDDNLHTVPGSNPHSATYGTGKPATKMAEQIIAEADLMTVSTEDLASEYERFQCNIVVCPNVLNDAQFERIEPRRIVPDFKEDGQIRLGWAGSNSHRGDMRVVVPVLADLMREFSSVRFVTIGDRFTMDFPEDVRGRVDCCGGTMTVRSFDLDAIDPRLFATTRYYDLANLANFDIGIAPLEHTTFNRCKSDLKLLEMGAMGIPMVASRFGPYVRYQASTSERVAILADSDREWGAALRIMISSPEIRRRLAQANLDHIRRHRLLSSGVNAWKRALATLTLERTEERQPPHVVPMQTLAAMVQAQAS